MNLLKLNEHCLTHISQCLNLNNHLKLSAVCEDLQTFVHRRLQSLKLKMINEGSQNFSIQDSEKTIKCDIKTLIFLKNVLSGVKFNRIQSLILTDIDDILNEDFDLGPILMKFVYESFPILKKLHSPTGNLGTYIQGIYTLEELKIDDDYLMDNVFSIPQFELRKLTFCKHIENWRSLLEITNIRFVKYLKMTEENYRQICEELYFELPSGIRKVILTSDINDIIPKPSEHSVFYSMVNSIEYNVCLGVKDFSREIVEPLIYKAQKLLDFNNESITIKKLSNAEPSEWRCLKKTWTFNVAETIDKSELYAQSQMFSSNSQTQLEDVETSNSYIKLFRFTKNPRSFILRYHHLPPSERTSPWAKQLEIQVVSKNFAMN